MAKRRHSDRETINKELGLEFALEELRGREAPKNKDVLLHLLYFLKCDGRGQIKIKEAVRMVVKSVKACWYGELASNWLI